SDVCSADLGRSCAASAGSRPKPSPSRRPEAVTAVDAGARRPSRWRRAAWLVAGLLLVLLALDRLFPPPLPDNRGATVVLAADGTPLRAFAGPDGVWRYPVTLDEVSPYYVEALLGYEDRWFHWHSGVNPVAVLRAAWQWAWHGRIVSGGSTLSMQVARILEPQPRSLGGKLRQAVRAVQLELRLSKRELLEIYINQAPFGGTIEGVEAASWAYLGKPSLRLSRAEAALLAVLPGLAEYGDWSVAEVEDARMEPVVSRRLRPPMSAPLLARRLRAADPGQARILSTLDAALQRSLEERMDVWAARLPPRTSAA